MFQSALTKIFPSIFILFLTIRSPWQHLAEGMLNSEECKKSLIPVLEWLNETLAEDENRKADAELAYFNNDINTTDYNKNKSVEILTDNKKWFKKIAENASYYLSHYNRSLSMCGGQWERMLEEYVRRGNLIPTDDKIKMLVTLMSNMVYRYSTSVVKYNGTIYRLIPELTKIMSDSRDFKTLLWAWREWHDLARVNKANFSRMMDLKNATELEGKEDMNWMESTLAEMKPLYYQLHAYVRARLVNLYSSQVKGTAYEKILTATGPIPAHLLGNMWAQEWNSLEGVLIPYPDAPESPNVTKALLEQNYTVEKIFKTAEKFFVSLGFQNMTDVFWKKSVLRSYLADSNIKMDCMPRAFDMVIKDDYRIKMCTQINSVNFGTVHKVMGYIVYFMEYRKQPIIFRQAANPVFAQAVGDTISLSVMSPRHLKKIGLVGESNEENSGGAVGIHSSKEIPGDNACDDKCKIKINTLMRTALSKIAFLPFAFAFESWRHGVFAGDITPDEYTSEWWKLKKMHQGVVPPEQRDSDKFDPGAKYHILVNSRYSRHFINFVGQFQFHEALCKAAGFDGELYDCDIYGSQEAGQKLRAMLSEGSSRPWSELMMELTGTDTFNATSIVNYFKPLHEWLIAENKKKNNPIGW